jgi:two-component system OmpR family sensor kinase
MRIPIRARLTLISAGMMAIVLVALAAYLYAQLDANLRATVDAGLRSRAGLLLDRIGEGGGVSAGALTEGDEAFAQLLAPDGSVIASSSGISEPILAPADVEVVSDALELSDATVRTDEESVPARLLVTRTTPGDVLVVGTSVEEQQEALSGLLSALAVGIPAAVAVAAAIGWIVAGAALRPVECLRREADAISVSEPGRRLAVPSTGDELARLAESLNRMLARIDAALTQERRFLADASHELRTPLANLRAELDLALGRARSVDELGDALRSVRVETDRLGRLAEDLLVLARAGGGALPLAREDVDVGVLAAETIESFAGRANSLGVELTNDAPPGTTVFVDPMRLRQALGNLIDNALRHASHRVTVGVERRDGAIALVIEDDGPGFPAEFVDRAGTGFSRPDLARTRTTGGTGLGLAIVGAIADAHGADLAIGNGRHGGAQVTLTISSQG